MQSQESENRYRLYFLVEAYAARCRHSVVLGLHEYKFSSTLSAGQVPEECTRTFFWISIMINLSIRSHISSSQFASQVIRSGTLGVIHHFLLLLLLQVVHWHASQTITLQLILTVFPLLISRLVSQYQIH